MLLRGLGTVLVFGVLLLSPAAALAESGAISVTSADPIGGIDVSATVSVTQSDCTSTGYCGWYAVVSAAPANQGCPTDPSSNLVWVGPVESTVGTVTQGLRVTLYGQGAYELCLFAYGPANQSTAQFLAQTSYTIAPITGTISSALQSNGTIAGTITINQPYCSNNCYWDPALTEQDGGGACPSYVASNTSWFAASLDGLGTHSWQYSFTPHVSSGAIGLCLYAGEQLVGSSALTLPPPPPPTSAPRLSMAQRVAHCATR